MVKFYNLGGGKENTCSILEAFDIISEISGVEMRYKYSENNRIGGEPETMLKKEKGARLSTPLLLREPIHPMGRGTMRPLRSL